MAFTLPALPYDFSALEPHIDAKTMEIHHGKHHQTYVNNLNAAIEKAPELASKSIEDLMRSVNTLPEAVRAPIRNNGGGHWNHSMFWQIMAPKAGGEPGGNLGAAIKSAFGDFAKFREQFSAAGVGRFGSGWAWLINSPQVPEPSAGLHRGVVERGQLERGREAILPELKLTEARGPSASMIAD
jgi:superoxide dismutase, Fe-Mn family